MQNEYDLGACGEDKIVIQSQNRFEQSTVPLRMIWYPPIYKEQFLCTANDRMLQKLARRVMFLERKKEREMENMKTWTECDALSASA